MRKHVSRVSHVRRVLSAAIFLALAAAAPCSALPATRPEPEKQKNLGHDHVEMLWYVLDYGAKEDGTNFAVARKYYTNTKIKDETAALLTSKYGYPPDVANSLYFTEYEYEYTGDGRQFAVTYIGHYDMLGGELHSTVFDNATDETKKVFLAADPKSIPGRIKSYVTEETSGTPPNLPYSAP